MLFIHGLYGLFGWPGLGFSGAAIATSCSRICLCLLLWLSVIRHERTQRLVPSTTSSSSSLEDMQSEKSSSVTDHCSNACFGVCYCPRNTCTFAGFKTFLKIGIPGAVQTFLEGWGFEVHLISFVFLRIRFRRRIASMSASYRV